MDVKIGELYYRQHTHQHDMMVDIEMILSLLQTNQFKVSIL